MKITRGGTPVAQRAAAKKTKKKKRAVKRGKASAVDALEAGDPGLQLAGLSRALHRLAEALEEFEAGALPAGSSAQQAMEGLRS